jgi:RNA polymerase sigma-B factor
MANPPWVEGDPGHARPDDRFSRYAHTGDRQIRDALVMEHRELARALARRYRGRGEPIDDLEQVAMLGLVKAVERFDPARGIAFPNFAVPTIQGELKRHFRGQWIVRVPRSLQERVLDLGRTIDELTNLKGRSPTLRELAVAMGESEETLLEAMEARLAYSAVALDPPDQDSGFESSGSVLGREDTRMQAIEQGLLVDTLLERLGPREQSIMRLRFFEEMTQGEIAARVGLSQMQVSRLIRHTLEHLRALAADPGSR